MADVEVYGKMLATLPDDDDHPYRSGPWRPQHVEYDAADLRVEGELPDDLYGVYLRNTENPLHPAIVRYHPFDGDGMIHKVSFRDGKVSYRNRFVRTDGLLAEQEAGRSLWAGLAENPDVAVRQDGWGARGRMKDAPRHRRRRARRGRAGQLLPVRRPVPAGPVTLDDLGKCSWGGRSRAIWACRRTPRSTTAPASCCSSTTPSTRPTCTTEWSTPTTTWCTTCRSTCPGRGCRTTWRSPSTTRSSTTCPLFWEPDLLARGLYAARFHPDLPSRFGVIPRRGGPGDIRWFEAEPTYVLHWVNAYEDGDEIVLDGFFQGCPEPAAAGAGRPRRPDVAVPGPGRHADPAAPVADQPGHRGGQGAGPVGGLHRIRHDQQRLRRAAVPVHVRCHQRAGLVPVRRAGQARHADRPRGALPVRRGRVLQRGRRGSAPGRDRGRRRVPRDAHGRHEP